MLAGQRESSWQSRAAGIAAVLYVVLFFAANFPTGVGDQFYGTHSPADVVTWAPQHESVLRIVVFIDLLNDWLFVLFVLLLVALGGSRSVVGLIAVAGMVVSNAVFTIVLALQYAVPQLARLSDGIAVAKAAVVLQGVLVLSLRPLPVAIAMVALGYSILKSRCLPVPFGLILIATGAMFGVFLPLRAIFPELGPIETAASLGLLIWTLVTGVVLLVRPVRSAQRQATEPRFQT